MFLFWVSGKLLCSQNHLYGCHAHIKVILFLWIFIQCLCGITGNVKKHTLHWKCDRRVDRTLKCNHSFSTPLCCKSLFSYATVLLGRASHFKDEKHLPPLTFRWIINSISTNKVDLLNFCCIVSLYFLHPGKMLNFLNSTPDFLCATHPAHSFVGTDEESNPTYFFFLCVEKTASFTKPFQVKL